MLSCGLAIVSDEVQGLLSFMYVVLGRCAGLDFF